MTIQNGIIGKSDPAAGIRSGSGKFFIGLLISVFFAVIVVYKVDLIEVYRITVRTSMTFLALSVLLLVINLFCRALRWKIILKPVKPISFRDTISFLLVGLLANNMLPFRAGELGRSVLLAKKERISKSSVLASVVVERVLDMLSLSVLLMIYYWITGGRYQRLQLAYVLNGTALIILLIVLAFITMLLRGKEIDQMIEKWAYKMNNVIARGILERLHYFIRGFAIIRDKKSLIPLISSSFAIWLITVLTTGARFHAFRLNLPIEAVIFCVLAVNFASALPSSPGQIGVAHYAFVVALSFYSVDKETAVAYGIVSHALTYLSTSFLGSIALLIYRRNL